MTAPWPEVSLKAIIRGLEAGVSVNAFGEPISQASELGVLKVSCVNNGRFLPEENKKVIKEDLAKVAVSPKAGDIIISRANTFDLVGASGYVREDCPNLFLSDKLWRVCLHDPHRDSPSWLLALLNSRRLRREFYRRATGTSGSMKNISKESLLAIKIPRPTFETQQRLGKIFQTLDELCALLQQVGREKRTFRRGLLQQLLTGRRRFPRFAGSAWSRVALCNVVEAVSRRNSSGISTVLSASGEHGLVNQRRYFNKTVAGDDLSSYYLLKRGEFAYNRSAMQGYPCGATKRLDEYAEGALSPLYLCFRIKDKRLNSDFLVHLFESGLLDRQLRRIARVGGRAHGLLNVTGADYFAITIPLPTLEEQSRISAVLNDCVREIDLLERLQQQLGNYKRVILGRLLGGEIPIPA